MEKTLPPIVRQLIDLRDKQGIAQSAVAEAIGVDQAVVSNWERGVREPKGPALKLLEAFIEAKRKVAA